MRGRARYLNEGHLPLLELLLGEVPAPHFDEVPQPAEELVQTRALELRMGELLRVRHKAQPEVWPLELLQVLVAHKVIADERRMLEVVGLHP